MATRRAPWAVSALAVACAWSLSAQVPVRTVALTFDDLPAVGTNDGREVADINRRLLSALDAHRAPATGFVIGRRAEVLPNGRAVLQQWIDSGRDLGNHTFSHRDLNTLTAEEFTTDLERGEASFRALRPKETDAPLFVRFPFNHTGDTDEKHEAVRRVLSARGYQVAVCTMDSSDYVFAAAYDIATRAADAAAATRIRTEYLTHTAAIIDWYTNLHRSIFGRETSHVMLLHVNRLNADTIEQLLALFEARGFTFVSLATAQSDEAYATPDTFRTAFGTMWGYRWARSLGVKVDGRLEPEPSRWVATYGR